MNGRGRTREEKRRNHAPGEEREKGCDQAIPIRSQISRSSNHAQSMCESDIDLMDVT